MARFHATCNFTPPLNFLSPLGKNLKNLLSITQLQVHNNKQGNGLPPESQRLSSWLQAKKICEKHNYVWIKIFHISMQQQLKNGQKIFISFTKFFKLLFFFKNFPTFDLTLQNSLLISTSHPLKYLHTLTQIYLIFLFTKFFTLIYVGPIYRAPV